MLARVLRVFASLSLAAVALTGATPALAAENLSVTVAAGQSVQAPGTDLSVAVDLANAGSTAASAGTLSLALSSQALGSASAISTWLAGTGNAGSSLSSASTQAVPATGTTSTILTIPGAALGSPGIWGIQATWTSGSGVQQARTVVTVNGAPNPATVSTLYALTPGNTGSGLLSSQDLSSLTASDGSLTKALDALAGKMVTVGIDPRILASIRALGSSAPASATAWLNRLQSLGLDSFALQYADADPALQAQLGQSKLMTAGDFPDQGSLSSAEIAALTAWNYNHSLLWPAASTVTGNDLGTFSGSGYRQLVLSSENVSTASSPLVTVGGSTAIVAQQAASTALAQALSASSNTSWLAAINQLEAQLSLLGGQTVVLAPDRVSIASSSRAASTFDLLTNSSVSRGTALPTVLGSTATATSISDHAESATRLATGAHLLAAATQVDRFAAVAVTPSLVTAPVHRNVMAMFGTGWVGDIDGWASAVSSFDAAIADTLGAVHVSSSSTINVLASEASLPLTLENSLSVPVHVSVVVSPSNGRLVVGETIETDIAADARVTVRVPVKARIGNGPVNLTVTLFARDGTPVGLGTNIPANVQADWEGWGAAGIAVIAAALFGFGIWRQIRRRRRLRAAASTEVPAGEPHEH